MSRSKPAPSPRKKPVRRTSSAGRGGHEPAPPAAGAQGEAGISGRLTPHRRNLLIFLILVTATSFGFWIWYARQPSLDEYTFKVVNSWPHDVTSFTQGLVWHDGFLYESTGRFGESRIRKVELETGRPLVNKDLDPKFFGEGLAVVGDRLIQVTWQNRIGIVYDLELNEIERFALDDDAWGLTYDGSHLILSDGTSRLRFLDPNTFDVLDEVTVMRNGRRMAEINELEYIDGLVYANVWKEEFIYMIRPDTGEVVGRINLQGLLPWDQRKDRSESVLNGIALNPETGNLFVTGKYWPRLFEIEVVPRP